MYHCLWYASYKEPKNLPVARPVAQLFTLSSRPPSPTKVAPYLLEYSNIMFWASLVAFAAFAEAIPKGLNSAVIEARQGGVTMLRFGCSQVVIDRLDPLVNPGQIPSTHVHQIVGGNAFNASMTTNDVSNAATCTTCEFSEDFSNYWTANLYYKAKNGTYKRVPQGSAALQFGDRFSNQIGGGILVYYVSAQPGKITAFKPVSVLLHAIVNIRWSGSNYQLLTYNDRASVCWSGTRWSARGQAQLSSARTATDATLDPTSEASSCWLLSISGVWERRCPHARADIFSIGDTGAPCQDNKFALMPRIQKTVYQKC